MEKETERQLKAMKQKIQKEKVVMMKELKKELEQELQEMKKQIVADMKSSKKGKKSQTWEYHVELRMLREEMERQRRDYMEREERLRESYERKLNEKAEQSNTGDLGDIVNIVANPTQAVARTAIGLVNKLIK